MSGKAKIRKLIRMPSASNARMKPIVMAPIRSVTLVPLPQDFRNGSEPESAPHKFAFGDAARNAIITNEVQNPQELLALKQFTDGLSEIHNPPWKWPI